MDPLLRAIKDLDPTTFHQFCFQLMSGKYPNAGIRYVEGVAGDEGLDNFSGNLLQGPTIWQCKAFQVTMLGDSQKAQIRDSLRTAIQNFKPAIWILCLNMNLDTKVHRWFQKLQKSYQVHGIAVADPFQAIDLARELMFRRTLREYYFPKLVLDPAELRAIITRTHDMPDSDLERLATENVEQWLDRIKDKDPRFLLRSDVRRRQGAEYFFLPTGTRLSCVFQRRDQNL